MTRKGAIVLLCIAAVGAAVASTPLARDEWSWWRADSHGRPPDYANYLQHWPHGRHAYEARLQYRQRQWVEDQKGLIDQAYKEAVLTNSAADAEYRKMREQREDAFSWKGATTLNTVEAYADYLTNHSDGQYAREAKERIQGLSNHDPQSATPTKTAPTQQ